MNRFVIVATASVIGLASCGSGDRPAPVYTEPVSYDGINFGTDLGDWSMDRECDDPRFIGPGMTETLLLPTDVLRDASDCLYLYKNGALRLRN